MVQKQQPDIASQLVEMKQIDYKNTLAIVSILELLIEKNILSKEDITSKAKEIDLMAFSKAENI